MTNDQLRALLLIYLTIVFENSYCQYLLTDGAIVSGGSMVIDHPQNKYYNNVSSLTLLDNGIKFKHNNLDKFAEIRGAISPGKHTTGLVIRTKSAWNVPLENRLYIHPDGNIGIGTSSPSSLLDVKRPIQNGDLMILGLDQVNPKRITMGISAWSGVIGLYDGSSVERIRISASNGYSYFNSGNVLIGRTSQSNSTYKLDVAGKVRANEIVVNTTGADYVFEDDYKLKSLDEVETFINENNHLPGIPSAAEMQAQGMSVGELNTKLLEKIEELMLYMIELKKENENIIKANNQLTETNCQILKRIKNLESQK